MLAVLRFLCTVALEQVGVDDNHGALQSRLHRRGQVVDWRTHLLYVRFEPGNQLTALRPYHVRVLDTPGGH
jgi:hypothetical protein